MAIPWFKHSTDTMDSIEFKEVPTAQRVACYGVYTRLRDMIGRHGPWDTLMSSRGLPWTMRQIAGELFMEPEAAEVLITALADANVIDKVAWTERRMVKIPEVIAIAADWFSRRHAGRVIAHLREYGFTSGFGSRPPRVKGSDTDSLPLVFDEPPVAKGDPVWPHARREEKEEKEEKRPEETPAARARARLVREPWRIAELERWFAQLWGVYPNHHNKAKANTAFMRLGPPRDLFDEMMGAVETQKTWANWQRGIVPHLSTWVNGRRWEDEPSQPDLLPEHTRRNLAAVDQFVQGGAGGPERPQNLRP